MLVIIDYGVGNLFSLKSSFAAINVEARVSSSKDEILSADRIILPGVGAFEDAARKLWIIEIPFIIASILMVISALVLLA